MATDTPDRGHPPSGVDASSARTWLFVPGTRPDRFARAIQSGADQVVIDLEDAVAPEDKDAARQHAVAWLAAGNPAAVRINAASTHWFDDDLAALSQADTLSSVIVSKAEDTVSLAAAARQLPQGTALVPLIETARGMHAVNGIALSMGVVRLAFGSLDYAVDLGSSTDRWALLAARSALVLASRVAGLAAPVDGVTTDFRNEELIRDDTQHARGLGFSGKLCIHPDQVPIVASAFAPTPAELEWARAIIATSSGGAATSSADGEMIDKPVIERALRLIADSR